jgi:hypothetical protein
MMRKETQFATLEEYTEYRVRKDWNMSMEEAQKKVMGDLLKEAEPYDKARFGELPAVLQGA